MPVPMKEWLAAETKKVEGKTMREMSHEYFFRDPLRATFQDWSYFFSPADGFITFQSRFEPGSDLLDVKGAKVTLNTIMGPHAYELEHRPCLAIGIFMSFLDVHQNRAPTDGVLSHAYIPAIRTQNLPMLFAENEILKKGRISNRAMGFMQPNARVVNEFWYSSLSYKYYMVQIADSDVSAIIHYKPEEHARVNQGERIGMIRWGSMCVLILPLTSRYQFSPLCKITDHVEAGTDALVHVKELGLTARTKH